VVIRLRILHLIDHAVDHGGAERFAVGLALALAAQGHDLWVCSTREIELSVAATLDRGAVRHLNLGRRTKWDVHRFAPLAGLLRRERIDVLHAHMFGSNVWGTLLGRACRVPVVIAHEQTWSYQGDRLRAWLDGHLIGRFATRFVAVSSLDAERMARIEGVPPEKIVMIPNAYVPRSGTRDGDLRAELGLDPSALLIGAVSVLRPQKALTVLLEAFSLVLATVPDAHLALAGDGPCRRELQVRARELSLDGRVHFLGRRDDVDSILSTLDVAAMSSDYEGTPLVAFECFANYTPLVATRVGGLPDIIVSGETGVLVPPRRPDALADALVSLIRDSAGRDRIAAAAAARLDEFTIDAASRRFAELYQRLAAEAAQRRRPLKSRGGS
jgi:glycosyltransferase involved in cell wall biosynthesis